MSLVSFVRCEGREQSQIRKAICESLRLIEYGFPNNVHKVVIKPNLCYYWDYSTGETTDPNFVAALVEAIREQTSPDVQISIVESDASAMKVKYAFRMLGYENLAKKCGISLINLSNDCCEKVETEIRGLKFSLMLPRTILDAELRINVPKIKYMAHVKISCALKNIYGCNPYPKKFKFHPKLDETIVALNKTLRFDLSILDGLVVSGVRPLRLGLVMASQDRVALDTVASRIVGINPRSVDHIVLAQAERIGTMRFIPRGIRPEYFETRFPRRQSVDRLKEFVYTMVKVTRLETRLGL
jgi:uncharacterized protein (DUF362 family)